MGWKKITEYDRWWGCKKQKIYKEICGDILREKQYHKQKTKVRTHSWDEKKITEYDRKKKVRMQKQKIYKESCGDI